MQYFKCSKIQLPLATSPAFYADCTTHSDALLAHTGGLQRLSTGSSPAHCLSCLRPVIATFKVFKGKSPQRGRGLAIALKFGGKFP